MREILNQLRSLKQNLKTKIKETEVKLDRLVSGFLDGLIEKEIYLKKKEELIKTKTDLLQRKSAFVQESNNWLEPLKEWLNSCIYAQKLISSNQFDEIKSLSEKIGTNRRLLDKKVIFELKKPFDLVLKYKEIWQESRASARRREIKNEDCLCWSGYPDSNWD